MIIDNFDENSRFWRLRWKLVPLFVAVLAGYWLWSVLLGNLTGLLPDFLGYFLLLPEIVAAICLIGYLFYGLGVFAKRHPTLRTWLGLP